MKKIILATIILFLILFVLPLQSHATTVMPESFFTVKIIDEDTHEVINPPININIKEKFEDKLLRNYGYVIGENPSNVIEAWYVPNYRENTIMEITVSKERYHTSKPFIYKVDNNSPVWEGVFFEHIFTMKENYIEIPLVTQNIKIGNESFDLIFNSTRNFSNVFYEEENNKLVFDVIGEPQRVNMIMVQIPHDMMNGTFSVFMDGANLAPLDQDKIYPSDFYVTESEDFTILKIYFYGGEHKLGITATHVVPEFSTSQIIIVLGLIIVVIIVLGLIIVVILGIVFTKRKTNLQIPEITSK